MADGGDSDITARLAVALEVRMHQAEKELARFKALADGSMGAVERRAKQAEARLASSIGQINLEHQLDVARAKGNSKVVEELTEELALRQKITQLTRVGLGAEEARALAEKQIAAAAAARKSNEGLSGAARSVISSTRLATLEEGGAKLGIYGGALEKLGPAGFVAAAGLAAAGIGLEEAHKAMEWAEDVEKVARTVGDSTTAIQQMDFAALKAGISAETLHEGLQKVGQTVGAFTSNVRDARVNPIFDALNKAAGGGFTKADVSQWQGPTDALEHIADGISKIKDRSQQLTLLKDLKIPDEMVPMLLAGGDALREAAKEAKDLGVVMDEGTVKKAAELNEKVKAASAIIGNQLRTAFINLAPLVFDIVRMMTKMATLAADTSDNLKHPFGGYVASDMSDHHLQENKAESERVMALNAQGKQSWEKVPFSQKSGIQEAGDALAARNYDAAKATHDATVAEIAKRAKDDAEPKPPHATAIVDDKVPKEKKPKVERDDTSLITGADAALDEAKRGLAQELAKQSTDLQEKADAEKAANFDTLSKQTDELVGKELAIDKAITETKDKKKVAVLRAAEGALEEAAVQDGLARAAKDEMVDREKLAGVIRQVAASAAQDAQLTQEGLGRQEAYYKAVAGLAVTADERREFERKALDAAQERERVAGQAATDKAASDLAEATARKDPNGIIAGLKGLAGASAAQAALPAQQGLEDKAFDKDHLSPWPKWVKDGQDAAADVGTSLQTYAVKSMGQFNEGVADAIVNSKSLGSTLQSIFKEAEVSLIQYLLKQAEIGVFGGGAPGGGSGGNFLSAIAGVFAPIIQKFAGGTDDAPGGVADVGEHGPERVILPKGSKVIPNNVLSGLNSSATQAMQVSSTTIIQGPQFHLQSPVVTDDLIQTFSGISQQHAAQAAIAGAKGGHQMTMSTLAKNQRNRLG